MVYILLAPGFEEAEALVPADLLRRAGVDTALVSLEGTAVPGGQGITVLADMSLDRLDLDKADMVVLPGGRRGVENLKASAAAEDLVREARNRGLWVAAICAAPTLLGGWGMLEGKKATCYPGMEDRLTGALVDYDSGVVVDGKLITSRAAGTAVDFGLTLIEVLAGADKAEEVRRGIHYN